jgi:hypothetical protein
VRYLVSWSIDVDESEADGPNEAAAFALNVMRDPESRATCFVVTDEQDQVHFVDLDEDWG